MDKMVLSPESSSYTVTDGVEVVTTSLDGGSSKYRSDKLKSSSAVTCRWILNEEQYTYIRAFYRSVAYRGAIAFTIDLILDEPYLREFTAHFVPGTMKLVEQAGLTFTVEATLEVLPIDADVNFDVGRVTLYNLYNTMQEPDYFDDLTLFVNTTMPTYIGV